MGLNQRQFAKRLGIAPSAISRYETGAREPAGKFLAKLAEAAKQSGADHLYDLFQAKRRSDVAVQVEHLSSSGSARRLPLWEVDYIASVQEFISLEDRKKTALDRIEKLYSPETAPEERLKIKEHLRHYVNENAKLAREVHEQLQPYSKPGVPASQSASLAYEMFQKRAEKAAKKKPSEATNRDTYAVHSLMSENDPHAPSADMTDAELDKLSIEELVRLTRRVATETEQLDRQTRRLANEAEGEPETGQGDSGTQRRKAG